MILNCDSSYCAVKFPLLRSSGFLPFEKDVQKDPNALVHNNTYVIFTYRTTLGTVGLFFTDFKRGRGSRFDCFFFNIHNPIVAR